MAAKVLYDRIKLTRMAVLQLPFGVLSALAAEIYLKCLLLLEAGQFPKTTHNLKELFMQLPRVTRIKLEQKHDEIRANHPAFVAQNDASADPEDLDSLLELAQESFVELRYLYEQDATRMRGSVFPLLLFSICVRDRILEIRPGWSDIPPTFPPH